MVDVARAAGVSLKTVSRHVNGATNIAPVYDDRIRVAIRELGYRRNLSAASIRPGGRTGVVGVIIEDIANPFYAALVRGIEDVLGPTGALLVSASSEGDASRHDQLMEGLLQRQVDGLVVVPPRRQGKSWARTPTMPPVVLVDRAGPGQATDVVLADDRRGARWATALLVEHGARRVGLVGDANSIATMAARRRGYREALTRAGLCPDPALEFTGAHTVADATDAVLSLLRVPGDRLASQLVPRGPDALFCANNRASLGALHAFRTAGHRLPMVGFDDFEAAILVSPEVSVVSQDPAAMGRCAAEQLLRRIDGDTSPPVRVVLPTTLTRRGSELP